MLLLAMLHMIPAMRFPRPWPCLGTVARIVISRPARSSLSTKRPIKSSASNRARDRRPPFTAATAPKIIIPPTFLDGQVPKAQLRLSSEESAARAARLANPSIIDELRAQGRFPRALWRFNRDPVRATDEDIARGWSTMDAYKKTNLKYWMSLPGHVRATQDGLKLRRIAYNQPEMKQFLSPFGGMLDVVLNNVKPALENLSYSPTNHAKFISATTRGLYTPTLFARLSESTSLLQTRGDLSFDLKITDVKGFTAINRLVLFGDHSTITTVDLLGPRIVLPYLGHVFTVAYLEHDVDSVPSWKQSAYLRESRRNESVQYLIDVVARISGTATIKRAPIPKGKSSQEVAMEAMEDLTVFQESFEDRLIVIRFASNPFLFDEETGDLDINLRSTWRVADIDYLTSTLLIERGRKLALCLSRMEKT